jgi:putative ABC transport system substrate-binding protein
MIRRREFIAGLGATTTWSLSAHGQQRSLPMIGFISSQASAAATDFVAAFRRGLAETGFAEGRNVEIEYRWADDQPVRLQGLAADLVSRRVAVTAASGGRAVRYLSSGSATFQRHVMTPSKRSGPTISP